MDYLLSKNHNGHLTSKRFDLYFFFYDIRLVLTQDFCLKRKIMWAVSVIYEVSELKRYLKRGGPSGVQVKFYNKA